MVYQEDEFQSLRQDYRKKDTFWRRWAGVMILVMFFILSWSGQLVSQLAAERQQAEQHGQQFQMSEFWPHFWSATFENWQSEWLQLTTQAIIVAGFADYFFRRGNEDHYKTHLMLEQLRNEMLGKKK
jgi:hypothetical protein